MHELLIIMVAVWTIGRILRPFGVPLVFGELLGGILVGPALLNLVHADSEIIQVISELGIFFLMLHTGLQTDHRELFGASKVSILVAIGGMLLSFAGGYYVGIFFGLDTAAALFVGMGLSVSAIAFAARIFKDCGIEKSKVAHITLGAAVIDHIIALVLFSLVVAYEASGEIQWGTMAFILLKIVIFFGVVLWLGLKTGPLLHKHLSHGKKAFTLSLIVALTLGYVAELMGLHSILGAFLAGLFMQEELLDRRVYDKIEDRFYGLSYSFFGPIFFASLAFHLDFAAFVSMPVFAITIIVVAFIGKLVGSGGAALLSKVPLLESSIIGLSMNNRGAVELVFAAIGLEQGIIDGTVFSILVTMAFATTIISLFATPPLAKRLKASEIA